MNWKRYIVSINKRIFVIASQQNVLTNSPQTLDITKTNFFQLNCHKSNQ